MCFFNDVHNLVTIFLGSISMMNFFSAANFLKLQRTEAYVPPSLMLRLKGQKCTPIPHTDPDWKEIARKWSNTDQHHCSSSAEIELTRLFKHEHFDIEESNNHCFA